MTEKYKLEKWKKTLWKGTKREQITEIHKLVKRTSNGRFAKDSPVIEDIRIQTYASGQYQVGYYKGKAVTRKRISGTETPEWERTKKEFLKNAQIYRCSLALNDIPYKGNDYYGFRIVAYSRNKSILWRIYPKKMWEKLIEFIESCLKYNRNHFDGWFEHTLNYMGKIPPELSNSSIHDSGKYELIWTKRSTGATKRHEWGKITHL